MKTTDEKSEEYSSILCNQSGIYSKGEIETAFVVGYNEAMGEIGLCCTESSVKSGVELIAKERIEQIVKHGWSLYDDTSYSDEQLLKAALFCIDQKRFEWPFGWISKFRDKIIWKNRIQQLTVAGALIAAEIDRLQNEEIKRFQSEE